MNTNTVPAILPDDSPRTRRTDPIYSHAAADKSAANLQDTKFNVLVLVSELGPLTGQALNEVYRDVADLYEFPRIAWDSPRKRAGELAADGYLRDTGNNDDGAEYAITLAGLEVIA